MLQNLSYRIPREIEEDHKKMSGLSAKIHVAMPGIIQSFNSTTQTATVQLSVQELVNIQGVQSWVNIPMLHDVPIVFPRASGYSITFPVAAGNECLVIFADVCTDAHFQSGGTNNIQMCKRRHSLSDGYAIITGTSQPNSLSTIANGLQLQKDDGSATINIQANTITINANTSVNVNASTVNVNAGNSNTVNINGRNFLSHSHSGVQTGSGSTGGVV